MRDEEDMPTTDSPLGQAIEQLRLPVGLGSGPIDRAMAVAARRETHWRAPLWIGVGLAATLALILARPFRESAITGQRVRFVLQSPAQHVTLIGDFNDWDRNATPLKEQDGTWSTTVALRPGRYRYAFLVNGTRVEADPTAPMAADEFGASTSAITIGR